MPAVPGTRRLSYEDAASQLLLDREWLIYSMLVHMVLNIIFGCSLKPIFLPPPSLLNKPQSVSRQNYIELEI